MVALWILGWLAMAAITLAGVVETFGPFDSKDDRVGFSILTAFFWPLALVAIGGSWYVGRLNRRVKLRKAIRRQEEAELADAQREVDRLLTARGK